MQRIPLPDDRVVVEGAADSEIRHNGSFVPRRLSMAYKHQIPMEVDFTSGSPSGVRLAFSTDSTVVGVELHTTGLKLHGQDGRPAIVDVVVDGELVASPASMEGSWIVVDQRTMAMTIEQGGHADLTAPIPGGSKRVELWLPGSAMVETFNLLLDEGASLAPPPPDTRPRWVHHGSSISHCIEAHGPSRCWPAVAAKAGDVHVTNLGLAGQCHLDQWMARTMRDLPADFLSLKVGINVVNGATMTARAFSSALHGFVDTVRDGHRETPFLLVSPIICPVHEDRPGPTHTGPNGVVDDQGPENHTPFALTLRMARSTISSVVAARRAAGDPNLHYLDGLALFDESDLADLPDGLHPNGDGYVRMGERFAAHAFADGGPFASR